jgi:4'-phosphopantetheinyl transferase
MDSPLSYVKTMETRHCLWQPSPAKLTLADDEVHTWRATLDLPLSLVEQLGGLLTADESDRAERFHFEKDRQHFIVGRGLLRIILGRYLRIAPERLRFFYNRYGKPFLAPEYGLHKLCFNMSHSGGLALFAITRNRDIGVDLERIRANLEYEEIAERFFSPEEVMGLHTIPTRMKVEVFFNCWTRKEAYIKAQGQGLSLPLDSFDVSFAPGEPATLLATRDDPREASRWTLQELAPGQGYVGALAVRGCNCRYKYWQQDDS